MKFLDEITIKVMAGKGGDGCLSFRREKFIPKGGPDGGNGGQGGNVYLKANINLSTLIDFRYRNVYSAPKGKNGSGKNCTGLSGQDLVIQVPLGTQVFAHETHELLIDLEKHDQIFPVAHGGKGGLGNQCFKSSTQRTPRKYTLGEEGEVRQLTLSLKLLADVGLVGLPNAGKSTFIRAVSSAKPKVADYPFTTLAPYLGIVNLRSNQQFVIADIPGLIRNAAQGAGLGIQFLKHLERTRLLLHVVDILPLDGSDPIENIKVIEKELMQHSQNLSKKPRWIIFNKMDHLPLAYQVKCYQKLIEQLKHDVDLSHQATFMVSSMNKENIHDLCERIFEFLGVST